jgi:uncharacterized membrane protein YbaN (DUF454 family)
MPRRAKVWALASMWTAISVSCVLLRDRLPLVIVIVALGLVGAAYIVWRVPLRERVLQERALATALVMSPDDTA